MALITGSDGKQYDTNNQSDRADLRKQGHYIDNSGVYAPGSGQRIGSTWSGSNSSRNEAPSPTQLPVVNGTPVSPSNGSTGPQTGAIMYRSDPQYASLFGPDTPGYSATSRQANAAPLPAQPDQVPLSDWLIQQGVHAPVPAPAATTDQGTTMGPMIPGGGMQDTVTQPAAAQPATDVAPTAATPPDTAPPPSAPAAYNPNDIQWNQPQQPASTGQVNPNQATANPNAGKPGQNSTAALNAAGLLDTPATRAQQAAGQLPAAPPAAGHQVILPNGTPYTFTSAADFALYQADQAKLAEANAKALQFTQGIEQGKLDVQRMQAEFQKAYNDALIAGQTAQRAQDMAIEAMKEDVQKQGQAITQQANAQQAVYQQGVLENQRMATSQTLQTEREKLALQRQQMRGRRLPAVRFA